MMIGQNEGNSLCFFSSRNVAHHINDLYCIVDSINSQFYSLCRSIRLYDVRASAPLKKVIMKMRCNTISWNPMEAFNFTAASEDHE